MNLFRSTSALLLLVLSGGAFAQSSDKALTPKNVSYPDQTVIDFDVVDVTVPVNRPSLNAVQERRPARFNSMIEVRASFDREMRESVSAVR